MRLSDYLFSKETKPSAFAALLGVSPSTVHRWVHGKRQPRVAALLKIQEVTNGAVTIHDLMPPTPPMAPADEAAE